jgi:hypothetical protein
MGFEPTTSTLARSHSTTELLPLNQTDPSTRLGISPAGSDARSTAQVTPAQPNRSLDYARDFASGLRCPLNGSSYSRSTKQIPRLRSGFRQRAQTPAKRLKLLPLNRFGLLIINKLTSQRQ